VRLFALGPWLRERWDEAYRAWADADQRANRRRLGWDTFAESGNALAFVAVLAFAAARLAGRAGVAGVFAGLVQAVTSLQRSLSGLLYSVGSMHTHAIVLDEVAALLAEPTTAADEAPDGPAPHGLSAEGLCFRYPGGTADVLADLNLRLDPGRVVALVGPNGAGKSTLAALLLGLYRPTAGRVRTVETASAVLQDFVRFTLPVRDNVGFGDLGRRNDDHALLAALQQAGSKLDTGLDDWLGADFGGPDLSGGQWLRLGLARGMLPQAGVVVLDEPTAAIDPLAEVDIVRRLLAFGRGRTAVVVSHRLGIARAADRILVLDAGRVVEEGSHEELRAAGGLYARMWETQAAWYRADTPRDQG
jgi:ATP-binding cassette subfamily B protein